MMSDQAKSQSLVIQLSSIGFHTLDQTTQATSRDFG